MLSTSITSVAYGLVGLLLVASPANGALDKPVISPPFPKFGLKLMNALTPTQSTHDSWEWGYVPRWCKTEAEALGFSAYDLTVFSIHYTDCNDVWIFCKHKDNPTSQIDLIDRFGRMPVRMRNYVRHAMALPGTTSAATYSDTGDMIFFGNIREPEEQAVWVHEMAHSIDWHNGPNGTDDFSSTSAWTNAFNADTAISDDYAGNNQAENFAQETVLALYDKVVPGGIGPTNPNWQNIGNQLRAVQNKLGNQLVPGGRCSRNIVGICDTIVCMGPAATNCVDSGTRLTKRGFSWSDIPINSTAAAIAEASFRAPLPKGDSGSGYEFNCTVALL